jgi:hypothetical protein
MDEQEFDALFRRPFGRADFQRADAQWGRSATLASALFGRTPEDLRRQLVAAHPQIPSGFDLADFRDLERHVRAISGLVLSGSSKPRMAWLSPWLTQFANATITIGEERYTVWEARCEIVRRAIDYLESR